MELQEACYKIHTEVVIRFYSSQTRLSIHEANKIAILNYFANFEISLFLVNIILINRAMCSPSQGPCCTASCSLKYGIKCREDNGCRDPSYCDGGMPQCPPSVNKPNKTICNEEFVCYMGVSIKKPKATCKMLLNDRKKENAQNISHENFIEFNELNSC